MVRDQEDKVEERRKVLATIVRTRGAGRSSNLAKDGESEDVEQAKGETREEAIKHAMDAQDYIDAKRDFELDQELLQTMKLKQIGETISLKLPDERVVIHAEPVIADTPVSPNVTLNLALGTALGLLISPLLALPLMWTMNPANPARLS